MTHTARRPTIQGQRADRKNNLLVVAELSRVSGEKLTSYPRTDAWCDFGACVARPRVFGAGAVRHQPLHARHLPAPAASWRSGPVSQRGGRVRVGDLIGEDASQESAAVGETLNLAARIQGESEANTVTISDATHTLVAGLFE